MTRYVEAIRKNVQIKNPLVRAAFSELFGTFLLVFIGECIVAETHLKNSPNAWINVNMGWGFAITFCVFIVAKVSGGHINPAVTLMFFSFGSINGLTTIVYFIAQTLGAFLGAAGTYYFYIDAITNHDGGIRSALDSVTGTARIFTTFAPEYLSVRGVLLDQIVGTAILCMFVAAILDKRNKIPDHLHALLFGFLVMMIGTAFGYHIGYPINPARDFGPRLFAFLIYGSEVFTYPYSYYFLMPIVGPLIGGVVGGWSYYLLAGYHIPDEEVADFDKCVGNGFADENIPLTKQDMTFKA